MISDNVIDAIGNTPLVRLRVGAERDVRVYAKLEMQNLFAMKDRVARHIITEAKRRGELADGAPVVESSSGTMALGVALVGTSLGHPVHIVTDPRIDRITLAKLEGMGCEVHVVQKMDQHGWQGARLTLLRELMSKHPGAFWPRQYENPDNPAAYRTLADELHRDLGDVDILVGSVGSGGSLCGSSRALRETMPELHVVGVDCVGSVLFGQPDWPQRLQSGLGNSLHPPNLDHSQIDEVHWLNDAEAYGAAITLAREEKLFAGNTSGSVYRVLTELARRAAPGSTVVGIFPDRGDRYTETVHSKEHWEQKRLAELPAPSRPRQVLPETPVGSWAYTLNRPDAPRPRFVFVESNTTGTGMAALRTAADLGFEPVLMCGEPDRYRGLEDTGATVLRCDTNDFAATMRALTDAVDVSTVTGMSTTSEFYTPTVARLAAELGLPAESAEVIDNCRNKASLRRILREAGVHQPGFAVVTGPGEVAAAVADVGLPCVVKPVDDSGSTGVLRCADAEQARAQVERILARTHNGRGQPTARAALVEELVADRELSVEMFSVDGEHALLGIVEKSVAGAPYFVEERHLLPAELPADVAAEAAATVRRALDAAGIRRGPSHTELKLTNKGAAIIEINPRLAGGMIPELFRVATGADLLECQIRLAAGLPVTLPEPPAGCTGIQFLLPSEAGTLVRVVGADRAGALDGVHRVTVTAEPGRQVAPPTDAYGRIGHVIAHGRDRGEVADVLARASKLITLDLERADGTQATVGVLSS